MLLRFNSGEKARGWPRPYKLVRAACPKPAKRSFDDVILIQFYDSPSIVISLSLPPCRDLPAVDRSSPALNGLISSFIESVKRVFKNPFFREGKEEKIEKRRKEGRLFCSCLLTEKNW